MVRGPRDWSSVRHVMGLISGTSLAQVILLIASPILTRLYTPEQFGVLALFVALTQILTIVASGRYEVAILLPESHEDAVSIALLGGYIAAAFSFSLLAVFHVFNTLIAGGLGVPEIGPWLYVVPVAVFFGAVFNLGQYLNLRLKAYPIIARVTIYKSLFQTGIQLGFGFLGTGNAGLILGRTASNIFSNWRLLKSGLAPISLHKVRAQRRMGVMAREYRRFPVFTMPASLLNVVNANVLNFALPILFSTATLGFYSLAMRVLGSPLSQISGPIGQVFQRDAAEELTKTGMARHAFFSTLITLFGISTLIFGSSYFFIVDIFTIVFGSDWVVAGEYAKILMPLFAARFIVSPLTSIGPLVDARYDLGINIVLLFTTCLVLWVGNSWVFAPPEILSLLAWSLAACYIAYLPALYHLAVNGRTNVAPLGKIDP